MSTTKKGQKGTKGAGRKAAARKAAAPKTAAPTIKITIPDDGLASAGIRAGDALLGRLMDTEDGFGAGVLYICLLDTGEVTEAVAGYFEGVPEEEDESCSTFRLRRDDGSGRTISTGEVVAYYTPAQVRRDLAGPLFRRDDLAKMIAAVLNHPDIPADLHGYIADWIVSYGEQRPSDPDRIRRALDDFTSRQRATE